MALPRLGDEFSQLGLSRSQRIGHVSTLTPCPSHRGQEHDLQDCHVRGDLQFQDIEDGCLTTSRTPGCLPSSFSSGCSMALRRYASAGRADWLGAVPAGRSCYPGAASRSARRGRWRLRSSPCGRPPAGRGLMRSSPSCGETWSSSSARAASYSRSALSVSLEKFMNRPNIVLPWGQPNTWLPDAGPVSPPGSLPRRSGRPWPSWRRRSTCWSWGRRRARCRCRRSRGPSSA
jgi:hypothetical protein